MGEPTRQPVPQATLSRLTGCGPGSQRAECILKVLCRSVSFWPHVGTPLTTPSTIDRQQQILSEAIDLLGHRVIGAQAKDVVGSGYSAAGAGLMDYHLVFDQLDRVAAVALIVQDAVESDAPRVRSDLLRWSEEAHAASARRSFGC